MYWTAHRSRCATCSPTSRDALFLLRVRALRGALGLAAFASQHQPQRRAREAQRLSDVAVEVALVPAWEARARATPSVNGAASELQSASRPYEAEKRAGSLQKMAMEGGLVETCAQ